MAVESQLCFGQCCFKASAPLPESYGREPFSCTCADGNASSQVGQGKGGTAIAAEVCAEQAEQCCVLGDRQKLAAGHRPTARSEVAGKPGDVADAWIAGQGAGGIKALPGHHGKQPEAGHGGGQCGGTTR